MPLAAILSSKCNLGTGPVKALLVRVSRLFFLYGYEPCDPSLCLLLLVAFSPLNPYKLPQSDDYIHSGTDSTAEGGQLPVLLTLAVWDRAGRAALPSSPMLSPLPAHAITTPLLVFTVAKFCPVSPSSAATSGLSEFSVCSKLTGPVSTPQLKRPRLVLGI